ncbi:DUF2513 domain-containing protein [Pseudomonas sp. HK3]
MKRDWNIIRDILLKIESNPADGRPLEVADFSSDLKFEYSKHVEMLLEFKLISGKLVFQLNPPNYYVITGMTWEGYELLDTIKSDTVWEKTKSIISSAGISVGLQLLKEIAISQSRDLLIS